jgi:hypothetical protein
MAQHLLLEIHTHIHHFAPTAMTTNKPTTASNASTATELESLVALVARLSVVSMDAVRLAAEVQGMLFSPSSPPAGLTIRCAARLPAVVAAEVVHARASAATAAAAAAAAAAAEAAAADAAAAITAATTAASVLWVRGIPLTPAELEALYPEGSGETWYVVICGRAPGMYRTAYAFFSIHSGSADCFQYSPEADAVCNGVPNQIKAKKTSRREALAWYRQEYHGPTGDGGVQKWTEA